MHGIAIVAVNGAAVRAGVSAGTPLADARAALPTLKVRPAERSKDDAALFRLTLWAGRYGPSRNFDGDDGFWADVTGVAHLFGGEEALIQDLMRRLSFLSIPARAAIAGTLGGAHALARFATGPRSPWTIASEGDLAARLAPLPVAALRLDEETGLMLRRLGLKRIGQLAGIPRESLAQRFRAADMEAEVLLRLDQALGKREELLRPLSEPRLFSVRRAFPEPLISSEILESCISALCDELSAALKEKGKGARTLFLAFYRSDGTVGHASVSMRAGNNDAEHFKMLLKEKLASIDAGFGIDLLTLEATRITSLKGRQSGFTEEIGAYDPGLLVDRLSNRLSSAAVRLLLPRPSHIPERSEMALAALVLAPSLRREAAARPRYEPPWPYAQRSHGQWTYGRTGPHRPAFLLERPEPISVMAALPDGPPACFTWRRIERRIARAEGPERIAPEWWRALSGASNSPSRASGRLAERESEAPRRCEAGASGRLAERESEAPNKMLRPRDYYRIEDEAGDAFWVFRHGLYGGENNEDGEAADLAPRWFVHGIYA